MSSADDDNSMRDEASIQAAIEKIAEEFLNQLNAGTVPDRMAIVDQHPDLAPELERQLVLIEGLHRVISEKSRSSGTPDEMPDKEGPYDETVQINSGHSNQRAHRIRCPHCGNKLQLVDLVKPIAEITCDGCGSTVVVDTGVTRSMSMREQLPDKIGRFPVVSFLGQGGFGVVYKGWDEALARHVAIKVPRSGYFANSSEKERFLREARNAGQLQHPRIVRVYDVAQDNQSGFPYIVSDFIEGLTLFDLLSGRRLSFHESARLIQQVAEAISHAHSHHIIHRDIKPSNILVDANLQPHVTDFGLARDSSAEIAITMDGEVLGTPAYMSPEQAEGDSDKVDFRSDIYSIGVVLYRLLSGELPFRGSRRMLLHQVLHDEPQPPRKINEHVPRDLETITLKAIAREPGNRYQTAAELAEDLRRWLNNEPILARRTGVTGRLTRWCRRNPLVATLTASVVALLILAAGLGMLWAVRESTMRYQEQQVLQQVQASELQSNLRLTRLLVDNGVRNLNDNKIVDAFLWFSEALRSQPDDTWAHRIRTRLVFDQCPTLTGVWELPQRIVASRFSHNGTFYVNCSENGTVSVRQTELSSNPARDFQNPEPVFDIILSSDDRYLLARGDKRFYLWSIETGQLFARLEHEAVVAGFEFSPDMTRIATSGHDGTVKLWTLNGQLAESIVHTNRYVTLTRFSPDSKQLLTVSRDSPTDASEVRIWSLDEDREKQVFTQDYQIDDANFDESGQRVASAASDGTVIIWNVSNGEPAGKPLVHGSRVRQIFWMGDSSLATVTVDGRFTRWNTLTGQRLEPGFQMNSTTVNTVVDVRNHIAATACSDGYVRVYWMDHGEPVCSLIPAGNHATALSLHPNGRILVTGNDRGLVKVWDLAGSGTGEIELPHAAGVNEVHFSPSDERVVTCSNDGTARIWESPSGKPLGEPMKHGEPVFDCNFDRSGQFVGTASLDKTAQLWDAWTGIAVGPRLTHSSPLVRLAFNPRADQWATADAAGIVKVWPFRSEIAQYSLVHTGQVNSLCFSTTGQWLATASSDKSARIWQAVDGTPVLQPIRHNDLVTFCSFNPARDWLMTCSRDRTAKLVSTSDDREYSLQHGAVVSSGSFSIDGTMAVTTDYQGFVRLWNVDAASNPVAADPVSSSALTGHFSQPAYLFNFAAIHPGRNVIAVAAGRRNRNSGRPGAGAVFLWDASTLTPLSPALPHSGDVRRVRFDSTGNWIASTSDDGFARLWQLEPDHRLPDELNRFAALMTGQELLSNARLAEMEPRRQAGEFLKLQKLHPDWFRCSQDEINRWNQKRDRLAEAGKQLLAIEPVESE